LAGKMLNGGSQPDTSRSRAIGLTIAIRDGTQVHL